MLLFWLLAMALRMAYGLRFGVHIACIVILELLHSRSQSHPPANSLRTCLDKKHCLNIGYMS